MLIIDNEKCIRCQSCVAECPPHIIALNSETQLPVICDESLCIHCGHCVAVCPEGALSRSFLGPQDCTALKTDLSISVDQAVHWIKTRRSIRSYQRQPVERPVLNALFDTVRYAPTAKNIQAVSWIVFLNRDEIETRIEFVIQWMDRMRKVGDDSRFPCHLMENIVNDWRDGEDRICRGAPHLVLACGQAEQPAALSGCFIALTTLELLAPAFQLGACWAGYFAIAAGAYEPLRETLPLPPGHQVYGAMMLGYPALRYHRVPPKNSSRIEWV